MKRHMHVSYLLQFCSRHDSGVQFGGRREFNIDLVKRRIELVPKIKTRSVTCERNVQPPEQRYPDTSLISNPASNALLCNAVETSEVVIAVDH